MRVRIGPVYTVEIILSAVPDNAADVASASYYPPAWSRRDDHPHSTLSPASSLPVPRVVVPGQQRDITLVTHSLLIHLQMACWSKFQDRRGGYCSLIWFSSLVVRLMYMNYMSRAHVVSMTTWHPHTTSCLVGGMAGHMPLVLITVSASPPSTSGRVHIRTYLST